MKPTRKQVNIADEILQAIMQTEEWNRMAIDDPCVNRDEKILDDLLLQMGLNGSQREAIKEAVLAVIVDYEHIAVFYGMSVIFSLLSVSMEPKAVTRQILQRVKGA